MKDTFSYSEVVNQLRRFFYREKKFVEVPSQSRLSILAACEDPETISQFIFDGINYPLPQTGQMWLECELLNNQNVPGFFCITTSYRNEPCPIAGRHDKIFPMFEFEAKGNFEDLKTLEAELLIFLGFDQPKSYLYEEVCRLWNKEILDANDEMRMDREFGHVISLEKFPQNTHPFWNMKHVGNNIFNKADVILYGMETIGSAERSINVEEMRNYFFHISNGEYASLLFNAFGKYRVLEELDAYLNLDMCERFGGGIGITRLTRAMKLNKLLPFSQKDVYTSTEVVQ